jgi:hypothetical protein
MVLAVAHRPPLPDAVADPAALEMAAKEQLVLAMRRCGASYPQIETLTGIRKSSAQRMYKKVLTELFRDLLADKTTAKLDVLADIEILLEELRPLVHGHHGGIPSPKDVSGFLRALEAKRALMGLDEADESVVLHQHFGEPDPETAGFLTRLAMWARASKAINVEGYQPVLPPGMDERTVLDVQEVARPTHAATLWDAVVKFPDDEADDGLESLVGR